MRASLRELHTVNARPHNGRRPSAVFTAIHLNAATDEGTCARVVLPPSNIGPWTRTWAWSWQWLVCAQNWLAIILIVLTGILSLLMSTRHILHSWLIRSRAKRRWRHAAIIVGLLLWDWYRSSARFGGNHLLQSASYIFILRSLIFIWGKAFFSRLRQTLFVSGLI